MVFFSYLSVVIIVPYRDRPDHLRRFLQLMHPFLQSQKLDYKMVVVEQAPGKEFNRAKLFNVGFLESKVPANLKVHLQQCSATYTKFSGHQY